MTISNPTAPPDVRRGPAPAEAGDLAAPPLPRVFGLWVWFDLALVLLVAAAAVGVAARAIHVDHIHVGPSNDQVGYITAARHWATHGRIVSHIVYPSVLNQSATKSYLYMPGYYACLAAFFKLFHVSPLVALLPSLLGFALASVCTYLIALRHYGLGSARPLPAEGGGPGVRAGPVGGARAAALVAAGVFIFFPANLYYACLAMTELPLTGAATLALCAFVYSPWRLKPWVGPLLLAVPFVFRETAALLAVPMAVLLLAEGARLGRTRRAGLRAAAGFCGGCLVVTAAVFVSPLAAGRPSLLKNNLLVGTPSAIYSDAYGDPRLAPGARLSAGEWASALGKHFVFVVKDLAHSLTQLVPSQHLQYFCLLALLLALPAGILRGWRGRDPMGWAVGLLLLCLVLFLATIYSLTQYRGMRIAMVGWPLVAVMAGGIGASAASRLAGPVGSAAGRRRGVRRALAGMTLVLLPAASAAWAWLSIADLLPWVDHYDLVDNRAVRALERMRLVRGRGPHLLVGPSQLLLPYLCKKEHQGDYFSFVPQNRPTLRLLESKYAIDLLILDPYSDLGPADARGEGYQLCNRLRIIGYDAPVYRRPAFAGENTFDFLAEPRGDGVFGVPTAGEYRQMTGKGRGRGRGWVSGF